jgi:hypothetical protein
MKSKEYYEYKASIMKKFLQKANTTNVYSDHHVPARKSS